MKQEYKRLKLRGEVLRALAVSQLTSVRGGVTGAPCDVETQQRTKCDFGCTPAL